MNIYSKLADALLPWYENDHRKLPWRESRDPYAIWISEIMLQQTRVEAVKGYYARFLSALPDIASLAKADDELLHKLWEGLGYYSRVRNLKRAAQVIMEQHNGRFPTQYDQVLKLPGIGEYTAGAVCSIAFNQPTPAVDGNVLRVISRLTNDPTPIDQPAYKKQIREKLQAVYPQQASQFTQALMELGATLCGPNRKPDCDRCPCKSFCLAFEQGTAEQLPVKQPKSKRRIEEKTVFIISCEGSYALVKRPDKGLLAGLWQFPDTAGILSTVNAMAELENWGLNPKEILRQVERKHIFTHIEWVMNGVYVEVKSPNDQFSWIPLEQIRQETALPTAYRQFLDAIL